MRFESKILLFLFLTLVVGFSIMNVVSTMYIKGLIEEQLAQEGKLYSKLLLYNRGEKYPEYIAISDKPLLREDYTILAFTGKHYIAVSNSYIRKKLIRYALIIFLWEGVLVVVIFLLLYYTIYRYLKRESESKEFLNILILALTHRLGNFLASQRLNLEMIPDSPPKKRLKMSLDTLERSYEDTLKAMEMLQEASEGRKEGVDISELVLSTALLYEEKLSKDVRIKVSQGVRINTNLLYLKMLIDLLIENAMKYSERKVYIRVLKFKGKNIVAVRNDFTGKGTEGGSGMGLRIANFIAGRIGAELHIKAKRCFTVLVCL